MLVDPRISPTTPMELLLADSSRAHLNPVAANPDVPTPGCPVESPFGCVAVRRGSAVTFPSSRALNACPKLRDRVGGAPLSATCVPVTFMGRALGVLHVTGPDGEVASRHHTEQLAILASQAGARIGTVRATSKVQLQASTDGLTGLTNRRTLESKTRALLHEGRALALVIVDLDNFKRINDTFGHEGGDQALRLFARALQDNTRTGDLVCRYGGDEFVVVLPGLSSEQAAESVHRLQVALLGALATGGVPGFTASYGIADSAAAGSVDELVRLADAALMTAKTGGRNRVVLHGAPASTAPAATQPPLPHSPVMDG